MFHRDVLKVRDIMTRNVFTLSPSCSVAGAAWALRQRGLHSAPVCAEDGTPVGVLTRGDLAEELADTSPHPALTVAEVMTPAVLGLGPDDPALDAPRLMATHDIDQVIVLDDNGGLLGMVSADDWAHAVIQPGLSQPQQHPSAPGRKRTTTPLSRPRRRSPTPIPPAPPFPAAWPPSPPSLTR